MKVYNLTDVAPSYALSSVAPRPIQIGGVLIPAGGSADLDEAMARQVHASMAPDVSLDSMPEWYTNLKGIKAEKAPEPAPKKEPKAKVEPKAEPEPKAKKTRKRKKS